MDDDDHSDANLGLAVKVISGEACEVSGAFAVPRQAVDHTLGADIRGATLSLNIKKWPSEGDFPYCHMSSYDFSKRVEGNLPKIGKNFL